MVPALILAVVWVIFNIYHNYVNSTITDPLTHQIVPIEGSFDSATIEEIKQRKRVNPSNEIIIEISGTPEPTPAFRENGASLSAETELDETVEDNSF